MVCDDCAPELLNQIIRPIVGQKAWGSSLGVGSYLTIEFGDPLPHKEKDEPVHGVWHLWVKFCAWRIEARGRVIAGSEDPPEVLERAVQYFNNLRLVLFKIIPPALDVSLQFDSDVILKIFPYEFTGEHDNWWLFTPGGKVVIVGGRQGYRIEDY